MDVSTPPYGRSCLPSVWNFATNLGKSKLICDGEMRWLRLLTQPIFISHPYYIYIRCLTHFICCGCAYGCVHTILRPLMSTKLLEFWHKSGQDSPDMWWWNEVIEAVDPTHIHLTSILYIQKSVWQPLYAVDVHMDVSTPCYGRSCRQSFWKFATNLGKSQLICDGEMRWLRL